MQLGARTTTIVFATDDPNTGLWRVPAGGGRPAALTTPDASQRKNDHAFPSMLPGGRGVLFTITAAGRAGDAQVAVLDLRTGQWKTLVRGASQAEYVDVSTASGRAPIAGSGQGGYLIYAAAGALRAVRFDPVRLEVLGDPVTVVDDVMTKASGGANTSCAVGHARYAGRDMQRRGRSLWVDRATRNRPGLRQFLQARLRPGTRGGRRPTRATNLDQIMRDTMRRPTFAPGMDIPHLARDVRITSVHPSGAKRYVQSADGPHSRAADGTRPAMADAPGRNGRRRL